MKKVIMNTDWFLTKSSNRNGWNLRLNAHKFNFDYVDFDIGRSFNNKFLTIILFGIGFDYGTTEGGFRLVNQWK